MEKQKIVQIVPVNNMESYINLFRIALKETPLYQENSIDLVLSFMKLFEEEIEPLLEDIKQIEELKKWFNRELLKIINEREHKTCEVRFYQLPKDYVENFIRAHDDWMELIS